MTQHSLVYYITCHGYGHGVRSCDIIEAILSRLDEDVLLHIRTALPQSFLEGRLPTDARLRFSRASFDVGVVQKDAIVMDVPASLEALEGIYGEEEILIEDEILFLKKANALLVVADVPAIPIAAARRVGITAVAIGNFGWDWIYEAFVPQDARWQHFVEKFRAAYRQATLLIRLPFAEPMASFTCPRIEAPLVASRGTPSKAQLAELTGADPTRTWVLLSFTALDWAVEAVQRVEQEANGQYYFFTIEPLQIPGPCFFHIARNQMSFRDVLASVDLVVSKPGFGILSDCIVNDKPLVHADRHDFPEYPVMVRAIERYLRHAFLPSRDLYAGGIVPYLARAAAAPQPKERLDTDGAARAAEAIVSAIDGELTGHP